MKSCFQIIRGNMLLSPMMETDEMNFKILENAGKALKPGGTFIFTTLNGLYPLYHSVKDFISSNTKTLKCNEMYYVPSEITRLLKTLDFNDIEILGCDTGNWTKNRKLSTKDFEMLVIAKKL